MKNILKIFFLICAIANIRTGIWHDNAWHIGSKVLLMPTLIAGVLWSDFPKSKERLLLIVALFFSWIGDILLLSQVNQFIGGLVSFLTAHVCYIILFRNIWKEKSENGFKWQLIIPVIIFASSLVIYLYPFLNELKIPVMLYAGVISIMIISALHSFSIKTKEGLYIISGAILFIASDSFLAINKFTHPIADLSAIVMLTYALAQLYITQGLILKNSSQN